MKIFTLLSTIIWIGSTLQTAGSYNLSLDEHLEPLRPLLDKTWKGTFSNSTPDKPIVDVARWERALNGQTVRRIHSVNDGAYGGEALLFWDAQQNVISFYYVTTGGFRSIGTLEFKDGKFIGHEDIQGNADGITQVRINERATSQRKISR